MVDRPFDYFAWGQHLRLTHQSGFTTIDLLEAMVKQEMFDVMGRQQG